MKCGDSEIDAAIDVVGKSQNENLTHQLIDFLVGEKDGVPKDSSYIYRLYLALKKYDDAAKTALIIAREEQDLGNYVSARNIVFETARKLEDAGMKVSLQLRQSYVLLHSYLLVKTLVKHNDHMSAARLLLRVVQSVSKFPKHVIQLLTSTVIECQRAGLKQSSYDYSVTLMRPEYRPLIDVNLKRKIEAIVRRRSQGEGDIADETSVCPISNQMIPQAQLECPTTRDALPMCAVTGRHMVLHDWCFCPVSKAPVLYSAYVKYIETELQLAHAAAAANPPIATEDMKAASVSPTSARGKSAIVALDPIMGKPVSIGELVLTPPEEAAKYIQRYNNVFEKKEATEGEKGDAAGKDSTEPDRTEEAADRVQKNGKSNANARDTQQDPRQNSKNERAQRRDRSRKLQGRK